jgi:hypothetical protein
MKDERIYEDGDEVEVWRPIPRDWAPGVVWGGEVKDGVMKYFVQISGAAAAQAVDPEHWYPADRLRAA